MALYLLELYRPDAGRTALRADADRAVAALEAAGCRCVGALVMPDDDALLLTTEAPSAERCEAAINAAGLAVDRITQAEARSDGT